MARLSVVSKALKAFAEIFFVPVVCLMNTLATKSS